LIRELPMETPELIITLAGIIMAVILSVVVIGTMRWLRNGRYPWLLRSLLKLGKIVGLLLLAYLLLVGLVAVFLPFGPVFWAVVVFVAVEIFRRQRAARQYGLLWLLTVSAERSMPLGPAIEAFARERRGSFSRRAQRLASLVAQGVALPDALQQCPGLLPAHATAMVRVGAESGVLAPALRRAATIENLNAPILAAFGGKVAYLLLFPFYGALIVAFIMLKIVPAMRKIFLDFEASLPAMTQWLITLSGDVGGYWLVFLLLCVIVLALLLYVPMRGLGWIPWDLPGMGWLARRIDTARILDALALAAGAQRPLPEGIASLGRSYPNRNVRRRLCRALAEIEAGRDWCESLYRQGLIRRPELAVLRAAQRVGNLPWALGELADSVRRRLGYRLQAMAQWLFPPMVIAMGLVVMFVVVALFLPVVALIQKLC
jgi:type II secretory pathway component PulF